MPNGSLNDSLTTCGTTSLLTCDPCYDMDGNGVAMCGEAGTWAFESHCTIKGIIAYFTHWRLIHINILFFVVLFFE